MYNEIEAINQKINDLQSEYDYYLKNMKEISEENEAYLREFIDAYYPGMITVRSTPRENVVRFALKALYNERIKLRIDREKMIRTAISNAWLNVADAINILDKFGIYYRTIRYGTRTLLVPQDFVLLNNVIDGTKLKAMVSARLNMDSSQDKDATVMSMYRKDAGNVSLNREIPILTSALLIDDLKGIPVYKRENDNIAINGEIVNIFPYEVISFIEYYIEARSKDSKVTIDSAYKDYSEGLSLVRA